VSFGPGNKLVSGETDLLPLALGNKEEHRARETPPSTMFDANSVQLDAKTFPFETHPVPHPWRAFVFAPRVGQRQLADLPTR
jgi:hypothetical protein